MSRDSNERDPVRPRLLRRLGEAALSPLLSLKLRERYVALRRDLKQLRSRDDGRTSKVRLDKTGAFDLDAMAFLHGQVRGRFEDTLARRRQSTARYAWIFLGLGAMFFVGWLYRLSTMTWTVNATLTALQFSPACAVFFLLAILFGLENYQIRLGRKVSVREFISAPSGFWPR
jgi:hypothetical protein